MRWIKRIATTVVVLLISLVVVAAAVATWAVRRPFPTTDGSVTLPGLEAEVTILRDQYGVPHIYAANERDLFFAQGYTHAQDRFWQMEFWRHIGMGRISEITGAAGVPSDRFIRTVGWNRIAERTTDYYRTEAPEFYAILEAYAAGVNAYLAEQGDNISLNRTILGLVNQPWEIEPWQPVHTVAWGVVMADDLSGNFRTERQRARLLQTQGADTVASIYPDYPYDRRPVIANTSELLQIPTSCAASTAELPAVDWSRVNLNTLDKPEDGFALGGGPFVGSNNWVVSGQFTASGKPLLADDPHLGIQMPSIWYEIGLHAPGFDVAGFSFAGVPGVIVGHNSRIAWGVTNVGPDVQDLFIERVNPDNPLQYEYKGEWRPMTVHREVIKVNGGDDLVLEVKETLHGPIISDYYEEKDVLALRWTAQDGGRVLQSVILLNRAANFDDFRAALRYWDVPSQNFVYADVDGNIGYQAPGLFPVRAAGNGWAPAPGWTGEYDWTGWIPYDALPSVYNPAKGYIVTANHAVTDPAYPCFLGLDWADGNRGQRIVDLIEAEIAQARPITAETFAAIQFDSYSLLAADVAPLLDGLTSADADVQAALDRLRNWDYQARRDSVAAGLFEIFFLRLAANTVGDELGEEWERPNSVFYHDLARDPASAWWDDVRTAEVEDYRAIALQSLGEAVGWFRDNVGGEMDDWTWGSIHTATFVSAPLGQSGVGAIEALVNRGPFPADGGRSIVNAAGWSWSKPAAVTGHVSMRMIADPADWDATRHVIPTGQSGHPYHRHYGDQIELWLEGENRPFPFTRSAVEAAARQTLVLKPGR